MALEEKQYPVYKTYRELEGIERYAQEVENLCRRMEEEYHMPELDTFLAVKDMIYQQYRMSKEREKKAKKQRTPLPSANLPHQ